MDVGRKENSEAGRGKTVHKYTRTLFLAEQNSWLTWMTEHMGDSFRLEQLISWDSDDLQIAPRQEEWLDIVTATSEYGTKR